MASEVSSAGLQAALGNRQQSSLLALKTQAESDASIVRLVEEAREQQQAIISGKWPGEPHRRFRLRNSGR